MERTNIGGATVLSDNHVPFAVVVPSGRSYGDNRLNLIWNDRRGQGQSAMVPSVEVAMELMRMALRDAAEETSGCDHDWIYGMDGSRTIRECTECHVTERVA